MVNLNEYSQDMRDVIAEAGAAVKSDKDFLMRTTSQAVTDEKKINKRCKLRMKLVKKYKNELSALDPDSLRAIELQCKIDELSSFDNVYVTDLRVPFGLKLSL